jgi:hypothetical protein
MQIGDCNMPATFQCIMIMIFHDYIGIFMHAYLDDLFIYSDSIQEHEVHLELVSRKLREHKFYLKEEKCELYTEVIDCLGHKIHSCGLHADADKMTKVCDWWQPQNYNDVQKFVRLVNYLVDFVLDISSYTGPLSSVMSNR